MLRSPSQEPQDVVDDGVDAHVAGVDDDGVTRLCEWAVAARRVLAVASDDRRLDVGDVAADLGDPALGAHPRRRRHEQLERGVGEHDRADVAPLDDAAVVLVDPAALTAHQLGANAAVGGDGADRCGDLPAADLDRRVDAVDDDPVPGTDESSSSDIVSESSPTSSSSDGSRPRRNAAKVTARYIAPVSR
jgi:hypothetical protein